MCELGLGVVWMVVDCPTGFVLTVSAAWRNAAAEGNSLSLAPAARASSLAREPWGCTAGIASLGNDFRHMVIPSAERNSAITWILQYPAPSRPPCRRRAAERLRELPSTAPQPHCCGYPKEFFSAPPKQKKSPCPHRTGGFSHTLNFPNPLPSTPASSTPAESAAAARNASSARLFLPNARSTPGRTRARKCWTHTRA